MVKTQVLITHTLTSGEGGEGSPGKHTAEGGDAAAAPGTQGGPTLQRKVYRWSIGSNYTKSSLLHRGFQ